MRAHPQLYEINTWPWLDELSRRAGRHLTLAGVPDREWDILHRHGVDIVYLMGIWKHSALGRQLARSEPSLAGAFDRALPGWTSRTSSSSMRTARRGRFCATTKCGCCRCEKDRCLRPSARRSNRT